MAPMAGCPSPSLLSQMIRKGLKLFRLFFSIGLFEYTLYVTNLYSGPWEK